MCIDMTQRLIILSILACSLLISITLKADGLSDLRLTLNTFSAKQPIKARVKAMVTSNQVEDNKPITASGTMEVLVDHDASGISVKWSQADLLRIQEEADKKNADPDSLSILRQAMHSSDAASMRSLLDHSHPILRDLRTASVQSDTKESLDGAVLRKLVFKLDPTMSESQKKSVKSMSVTLNIWVNDANIPVYSEEKTEFKGSRFFISFDSNELQKRKYQVVGDRLVVTQLETTSSMSASIWGSTSTTNKYTVTIL